jgi:formylglycine-generating enzyme required for sulfatase activity
MLGNMWEWCHDEFRWIDTSGKSFDDIKMHLYLNESTPRLLRGGTVNDRAASVRSASRIWVAPAVHGNDSGFRPSRTYP